VSTQSLLDRCLAGHEPTAEECLPLCDASGDELAALLATADQLRREQCGDDVHYVINRNINFTNVCVKGCRFCAFSRAARNEQAYFLDIEEVVRRAVQAAELGATEVCIQAGLPPGLPGRHYVELCRAVKQAVPALHIHAFSPEEVKYGAELCGISYKAYIAELIEAGLGSLPGTAAEVLDDVVRERIAPGRITTSEWIEVITSAHSLGLPTTSTLMFGHVENDRQRLAHLETLRTIQHETGGFTEFVPLAFVHQEAPMFVRQQLPELRAGATENEVLRLYAIARLMLGKSFRHIQVSWVKHGLEMSKRILSAGADDLGGTLMNESISTAAGAAHGQLVTPAGLRAAIREVGRRPVQRDTRYRPLRVFEPTLQDGEDDRLDHVTDAEATFGSYVQLTRAPGFRFRRGATG
jgi:7,8-didemethyl-8-hydroxy-5-deazariboflavin synthase CofH subunit